MAIVVPPPNTEPQLDLSVETLMLRKGTHWFIHSDPTQIQLIPESEVRSASGAISLQPQAPRAIQTFRLIPMSHTERPVGSNASYAGTGGAVMRKYDFTLLGEWNCEMAENDFWEDDLGQKWVVDALLSYNGYERKGMITSYGRRPSHG